jgi:hypothetical protein
MGGYELKGRHAERSEASLPRNAIQSIGFTYAGKMLRCALHDGLLINAN